MEIEASLQVSLSTNIHFDNMEDMSDLKIFSEYFRGPLKVLWRATCGPQAATCSPLLYTA